MTIYLVSCVSQKATTAKPAQDLYLSNWFRKAKAYVLRNLRAQDRWFILSAKHHLVAPERRLAPYEATLLRMKQIERKEWAKRVTVQILRKSTNRDQVVILAGKRYREFLTPNLEAEGYQIEVPMRGLGIGRQLAWLSRKDQQERKSLF